MTSRLPELSIVIGSVDPGPVILDCLAALERQAGAGVEVLVVDASSDDTAQRVRARFPWVRIIDSPVTRSLPKLRGLGMAAARAPVVGILDVWCLVGDGWIAEAMRVHRERPELGAGGGVELALSERRSLVAWATYLFDYWEFVPPFVNGLVGVLPGNNIIYKRAALAGNDTLRTVGFWKAFTNARLKESGHGLWSSPGLAVRIRRRLPLGHFFRSRYHHGRSYAAMRVEAASWRVRVTWALIAPGLPLLFIARQIRGLASKRGARTWFVACAPLLLAFHASWAWGELCGYLGGPGRSHDAIRF
jgi:glycosyltransferase involved in cell wall biosynthesis